MQKDTQKTLAEYSDTVRCDEDWSRAEIVCGGFPCQDISHAGRGSGIAASRSGLWAWLCGAIRMVRPKYAIVENVAALLNNGMDTVLGDLAEIGYDAEWHCIPASHIGAPHERDRVWIIADRQSLFIGFCGPEREPSESQVSESGNGCGEIDVTDLWGERIQRLIQETLQGEHGFSWCENIGRIEDLRDRPDLPESLVCRVNDGISERLYALGNAVVPQIPEIIGRAIMEVEKKSPDLRG